MDEPVSETLEWYTLLDGSHSFRGARARKGEGILLTEKEANKLGNRVVLKPENRVMTTTQATNKLSQPPSPEIARDWSNILDSKATDIINEVNRTASIPDLESLYELEEKGQNRSGVLKSIEKRVAQLEGG